MYIPDACHMYIYICVCTYISTYNYIYNYTYLSNLSIYLSTYLPIYLPTYLPTYLSIYLSIYLCVCKVRWSKGSGGDCRWEWSALFHKSNVLIRLCCTSLFCYSTPQVFERIPLWFCPKQGGFLSSIKFVGIGFSHKPTFHHCLTFFSLLSPHFLMFLPPIVPSKPKSFLVEAHCWQLQSLSLQLNSNISGWTSHSEPWFNVPFSAIGRSSVPAVGDQFHHRVLAGAEACSELSLGLIDMAVTENRIYPLVMSQLLLKMTIYSWFTH